MNRIWNNIKRFSHKDLSEVQTTKRLVHVETCLVGQRPSMRGIMDRS